MSPYTIGIFRQTDLSQEAIRLTAGDGGPSIAVKHFQTLKVVLNKARVAKLGELWVGLPRGCLK